MLLACQLFLRDFRALQYERQVRPGLLASGYTPCVGFTSAAPDWRPDDCDVVRRSQTPDGIEEHYFSRGGAEESRLVVPKRGPRSMHTGMRANQASLWLSSLAFLAILSSIVHRMVRTGKVTTWSLAAEPDDRIESLLRLYGVPLFLGSILIAMAGR